MRRQTARQVRQVQEKGREESSFSEEKEAKRLLSI
jgi:hypothetical protein